MSETRPIRDDELAALFRPLSPHFPLALAVSGGSDSMALMHMMACWLSFADAPGKDLAAAVAPVIVLTVDHGLRDGSADEAAWVGRQAESLGFPHRTLVWEGAKPSTGVQAAARQARYRLIDDFLSRESRPPGHKSCGTMRSLVTAHHLDDQAETLLMRLARGSGVVGLASMALRSVSGERTILRPLLEMPKARLVATLRAGALTWLSDPSNDESRFERVRLRAARPALEAAGITNAMLAFSAARLERARSALHGASVDLARKAGLDNHEFTFATLDHRTLAAAPEELRIRLLMRLLVVYGGQEYPPRLTKVEQLAARLAAGALPGATLAGCHVTAEGGTLSICREPGRDGLPELTLAAGEWGCWDLRFDVSVAPDFAGPVQVAALGGPDWAALKARYRVLAECDLAARVAVTLPALRSGRELVCVPHLGRLEPDLLGPAAGGTAQLRAEVPARLALWAR